VTARTEDGHRYQWEPWDSSRAAVAVDYKNCPRCAGGPHSSFKRRSTPAFLGHARNRVSGLGAVEVAIGRIPLVTLRCRVTSGMRKDLITAEVRVCGDLSGGFCSLSNYLTSG
jgi:hypothetical protein